MANVTIDEYELDQLHQTIAEKSQVIDAMREGLQELYSNLGEDPLVEKVCSPLIDKYRNY